MGRNVFYASKTLLAIWTRFLPRVILGRFSSLVMLGFGVVTFAGGLSFSLYLTYLDLRYLWVEHKLARSIEHLEKMEMKSAAAIRRCEALEKITTRGKRMVTDIERWEEGRKELDRILIFHQLPAACAATDDVDPVFEGYDTMVRRKETMWKIKELNELDRHLNEEMQWWNEQGET